ncbi:hypothetical protein BsWGS_18398 [Bradybaena similaris]
MPGELVTSDPSAVRSPWTSISQTRPASCVIHARSDNFRHAQSVSARCDNFRHARSASDLHVTNLAHARSVSARDVSHPRNMPWQHRPKSTQVTRNTHYLMTYHSQKVTTPETGILPGHTECERVRQLEHEPTRQHKFRNHLPLKRSQPLSWQKSSEAPVTQLQLGPGYILSKTRSSSHVTLSDEFFEPPVTETSRDSLCEQLQQQISDLTLHLEDERLSHKQTRQKAKQDLRDRIDHMNLQFQDQIRDIKAEHQEELVQQKQRIQAEHTQVQNTLENQISRMAKEIEFLQSAFETYKGSLHTEATH